VIVGRIAARITAGQWPPGTALPPQKTLADDHAAAPTVISLALRQLAAQRRLIPVPFGGGRSDYLVPGTDGRPPAPLTHPLQPVQVPHGVQVHPPPGGRAADIGLRRITRKRQLSPLGCRR
jgi:DNA-binding transcriptional MocR family regulator